MKRNVFLMISTVVFGAFGLGLLLVPHLVASIYGSSLNVGGEISARLMGASLIGYALMNFWLCEAEDSATLTAFLRGNAAFNGIALVLTLSFTVSGMWGTVGWSAVVMHALFGAGYVYYASR